MTLRWMPIAKEFTRVDTWQTTGWIRHYDNSLNVGRWRSDSGQPARVQLYHGTQVHDWINVGGMFVVSERLRNLFEEFRVHAEYLSVKVIQDAHEVAVGPFYCCNLLDAVDCFDFEKGECTFWPSGDVKRIKVFRIHESKAADFPLFRMGHGRSELILINDKLAAAIKDNGLTGMTFMTIESWPKMAR